jgi:hypothetical protein
VSEALPSLHLHVFMRRVVKSLPLPGPPIVQKFFYLVHIIIFNKCIEDLSLLGFSPSQLVNITDIPKERSDFVFTVMWSKKKFSCFILSICIDRLYLKRCKRM